MKILDHEITWELNNKDSEADFQKLGSDELQQLSAKNLVTIKIGKSEPVMTGGPYLNAELSFSAADADILVIGVCFKNPKYFIFENKLI